MEKNLPKKDPLEQLLREELGGYEDSPPEHVWIGISSQTDLHPGFLSQYRSYLIWAGSIAASVIILLIAQQFYFEHRIEQLQAKGNQQAFQQKTNKKHSENFSDLNEEEFFVNKSNEHTSAKPLFSPQMSSAQISVADLSTLQRSNKWLFTDSTFAQEKKPLIPDSPQKSLSKPPSIARLEAFLPLSPLSTITYLPIPDRDQLPEFRTFYPIIKPLRQKKVYLEGLAMKGTRTSSHLNKRLPDIPAFTDRDIQFSKSVQLGVLTGINPGPRISIITGLLYEQSKQQEKHQVSFKRKDRVGHLPNQTGGPNAYEYNYHYKLNSAAGLVDMQLSLVQRETDIIPTDNSLFEIKVLTEESHSSWSIPLLIEYQMGNQRIKPFIRTGLISHFQINHQFELKDVSSSDNFLIERPNRRSKGTLAYTTNSRVDFMLSLGLNYQLDPKWSINVTPTYTSSLSDNNRHPLITAKSKNIGIGASLQYVF